MLFHYWYLAKSDVLVIVEELLEEVLAMFQAHDVRKHPVGNALQNVITSFADLGDF
jgi:hypothetical protein